MKLKSVILLKYGSIKKCALACDIPYATLYDICNDKTQLSHCSCRTALRLSKGLNMTVDELLKGESFQMFRDNLHNQKKAVGDRKFLLRHLEADTVQNLWDEDQKVKSLYLLAMIDLLCKRNQLPLVKNYNKLRRYTLDSPFYVGDSVLDKDRARLNSLEEFASYNIFEGTIDDAI